MTENGQQPFSEAAALRELEALQREIEQSKVRRREANDAFDRFLRSFDRRAPPPDETLVLPPAPAPLQTRPPTWPPQDTAPHPAGETEFDAGPDPPRRSESEPTAPSLKDPLSLDAWADHSEPSGAAAEFPAESDAPGMREAAAPAEATAPKTPPREPRAVPAAPTAPVSRSPRRIPPAVGLLAVLVVGAALFLVWRGARRDPSVSTEPVATDTAVAQPQPRPAAAAPAPPAVPVPVAEVSTVRRVWVRVLVDGQRVVERELPAESRIPLQPTSQIQVRAGDAGAVRVSIRGKDQGPVGRDGVAATKLFPVTPAAVR